mmetsp:Transcript_14733/g.37477  ORF Transcript_14733/g.37477 Transcript_14733/m.37477 type:complete len:270 (+) Transcript_14733:151-960(+)
MATTPCQPLPRSMHTRRTAVPSSPTSAPPPRPRSPPSPSVVRVLRCCDLRGGVALHLRFMGSCSSSSIARSVNPPSLALQRSLRLLKAALSRTPELAQAVALRDHRVELSRKRSARPALCSELPLSLLQRFLHLLHLVSCCLLHRGALPLGRFQLLLEAALRGAQLPILGAQLGVRRAQLRILRAQPSVLALELRDPFIGALQLCAHAPEAQEKLGGGGGGGALGAAGSSRRAGGGGDRSRRVQLRASTSGRPLRSFSRAAALFVLAAA